MATCCIMDAYNPEFIINCCYSVARYCMYHQEFTMPSYNYGLWSDHVTVYIPTYSLLYESSKDTVFSLKSITC